jgi:hypothetical protein
VLIIGAMVLNSSGERGAPMISGASWCVDEVSNVSRDVYDLMDHVDDLSLEVCDLIDDVGAPRA